MKEERSQHGRRYSEHLIEKWETLEPDGTKTHLEFELTRKTPNAQRPRLNEEGWKRLLRKAAKP